MMYVIADIHLQHGNVIGFSKTAAEADWQGFKYDKEYIDLLNSLKTPDDWDKMTYEHWKEALKDDPDADVYILGDSSLGNLEKSFQTLCKLGELARLHLIKGNHDNKILNALAPSIDNKMKPRFCYKDANIIPWKVYDCERGGNFVYNLALDYAEVEASVHHSKLINGKAILCHFPIAEWNSPLHNIMLYGHVHNNRSSVEIDKMFREGNYFHGCEEKSFGRAINCGAMMPYMNWSPKTIDQLIVAYDKAVESAKEN